MYLMRFIAGLLSVLVMLCACFVQGVVVNEQYVTEQRVRVEQLAEDYQNGGFTPVDESSFTAFDLSAALEQGVKFNEVAFLGTHNSYQTAGEGADLGLYTSLSWLTFGLVNREKPLYDTGSLTAQFNAGLRSVELDLAAVSGDDGISFLCCHSPALDMSSSCCDFETALREIRLWSENNPGHLPLTLLIEPKTAFPPVRGTRYFHITCANALDDLLRACLGDALLTPADMLAAYPDFAAMRGADGWRELGDTRGRVLVLLHPCTVSDRYIAQDESLRTQAMFPVARYADRNKAWASFLLVNDPAEVLAKDKELFTDGKFVVRTRVDSENRSTADKRETALACGAQLVSTDNPPLPGFPAPFTFADGKTVRLAGES